MSVEKAKVRTAIDLKFKGKSLSKDFKDKIATRFAAKIDKDEDIEEYINDREDIFLEASAEADRVRTATKEATEKEIQEKLKGDKGADKEPDIADDPEMPAWAKALMSKVETTSNLVSQFQQQKQTESLEQRFRNDPALKGVPELLIKRAIPKSEEQYEASKEEIVKEWSEFATQNKLSTFGADAPVGRVSVQTKTTGDDKPDEAVANFAKAQNEKFLQEQSKN